jgi:hypothetical protein
MGRAGSKLIDHCPGYNHSKRLKRRDDEELSF